MVEQPTHTQTNLLLYMLFVITIMPLQYNDNNNNMLKNSHGTLRMHVDERLQLINRICFHVSSHAKASFTSHTNKYIHLHSNSVL